MRSPTLILLTTDRDALLLPLLSICERAERTSLRVRRFSDRLFGLYSVPQSTELTDCENNTQAGFAVRRDVLVALVVCASRIATGGYGGAYLPALLKPLACRRPKAREPPQRMLASLMP